MGLSKEKGRETAVALQNLEKVIRDKGLIKVDHEFTCRKEKKKPDTWSQKDITHFITNFTSSPWTGLKNRETVSCILESMKKDILINKSKPTRKEFEQFCQLQNLRLLHEIIHFSISIVLTYSQ